jgi:biotin-dependent carboxylase-like uncharacterized protein
MTLTGAALRVLTNTTFALAGVDFCCRVNGVAVPRGISWFARAGSTISFAGPPKGLRAYLAVAGGLDVPPVLGSRSTSAYGGFGGYAGRPLRAGDILGVAQPAPEPALLAGRVFPEAQEDSGSNGTIDVRYVPYQGRGSAGDEAAQHFTEAHWIVSERSDRMGIRLSGEPRLAGAREELASFPVVQGAIQLPPDGQPIVLGPDHQSTGGYPLLGVVAECDRIRLAQARAGDRLRFSPIEREEARALAREADRAHQAAIRRLPPA